MRHLSFFNKIIFALNLLAALLLSVACLSPHISANTLSFLPFLGLATPFLVMVNLLFFTYWVVKRKRQMLISLIVLIFGFFALGTFIRFNTEEKLNSEDDLVLLSYNVRQFNKNHYIDSDTVFEDIQEFIESNSIDIVCIQEAASSYRMRKFDYPYKYFSKKPLDERKTSLSIFSKYPIINTGTILFSGTKNNACFADVVIKSDTVRVYNMHMQSLGITPGSGIIRRSSSQKLYQKLTSKFKKQEEQAQIIANHANSVPYKKIMCGDFNNNQYSRTYSIIKENRLDSFNEAGQGFGRTFKFHHIPVRIDFILVDPYYEVKSHSNFDQVYSDHFPIMAAIRLKSD